jgi:hypothetical protein
VWVAKGSDGQTYLGLFNLNEEARVVGAIFEELGIEGERQVVDVWSKEELGKRKDFVAICLEPHAGKLLRLK